MSSALALESRRVAGLPLVNAVLGRLGVDRLLCGAIPDRGHLPAARSLGVLLRDIALHDRQPVYTLAEWASSVEPSLLGLEDGEVAALNDDRVGRALDRLFDADRAALMTELVLRTLREFEIDLDQLHNDSTTLTLTGDYRGADGGPVRSKPTLKVTYGHNKDHRPDLKQLVWSLSVTSDGAVPVHYNLFDGNVTDDQTHIETWKALREVVGGSGFLYVADAKLCTRENMAYLHERGGRFITVLPRTRKEDARFKRRLLDQAPAWQLVWERAPLRRSTDPPERFEALEDPELSAEGYRIVWYRSSEKWRRDERTRDNAIHEARWALHRLGERVGRGKLKTREQVQQAVDQILDHTETRSWLSVQLLPRERHTYKQGGPGRPGRHTRYVRHTTTVYEPAVTLDTERIQASAVADGIFPLITNIPAEQLSALDLLTTYKYQAFVEKRHEQLKTAAEVMPVNYKTPERIEAFLFLYFIAITLHALLEREVREAMNTRGLRSIPIYPEERACRAPTADKLLGLFDGVRRHRLFSNGQPIQMFWDTLTDVQRLVLDLLGIPTAAYGQ